MRLLALDQASKTTGFSIWNDEEGLIEYGSVFISHQDVIKRFYEMKKRIEELIKEYKIDCAVLENVQRQQNVQTLIMLARLLGILELTLYEHNIDFSVVNATTWKSKVGIKGRNRNEQKRNAINHVKEKYEIDVNEDVAEAICIGEYQFKQIKTQLHSFE